MDQSSQVKKGFINCPTRIQKYNDNNFNFNSVSDPDPVGSVSTKGNVDLDPGTQKNHDKLAYKSTKIIKI